MAKAGVQARKSKQVKSAAKTGTARKRSAATGKAAKEFMLKDKKKGVEGVLIVAGKAKASTAKPKRAKAIKATAPTIKPLPEVVKPVSFTPPNKAAPAPQLPVVWKKHGPADSLTYWLRSTGRKLADRFRYGRKLAAPTQAPIGATLRSKNDLLREIAALRQENAIMRDRLGLPRAAFGRQVADVI